MRKCAKEGCKNWAPSEPHDRDLCYDHKKAGCFSTVLWLVLFGMLLPNAVMFGIMHATPRFNGRGEMCWVKDLAWPWEKQERDVQACIGYIERP